MYEINISVRDLVEFSLRKGDIDARYTGRQRGKLGTRAHQKIQKSYKENYTPEVTVSGKIEYEDFTINLQGRIDGIIDDGEHITVDEIKSTATPLEKIEEDFNEMHWAQAKVYAFLYCRLEQLDSIGVQLTYFNINTKDVKRFYKAFAFAELDQYVCRELLDRYIHWAQKISEWYECRNLSLDRVSFPFENYRNGQRKLIVSVYKTIEEGRKIFVSAPTGIGKTISTLYPSILSVRNGVKKVFYLTSKNTQKEVVEKTLHSLVDGNLKIKYASLTAKEKICFKEKANCSPEYCEYARGHFDRISGAVEDIFDNEFAFDSSTISAYAEKHRVCPFEFSLDLTLWSDVVVCDYNYIFDPRVSLKRFVEEKDKYVFLVDEAHNLVDRSRDMYSCQLSKRQVLDLRKKIGKSHVLYKPLGKINKEFLNIAKGDFDNREKPDDLILNLSAFIYMADKWLIEHENGDPNYEDILEFYFEANNFLRVSDFFGDNYRVVRSCSKRDCTVKLLCLDSSQYIKSSMDNGVSSVYFSATLLPLKYFVELLGGEVNRDYHMCLDSPFDKSRICLMISKDISTYYKDRCDSADEICKYLYSMYSSRRGNYMAFFPSHEYMDSLYQVFREKYPQVNILKQSKSMSDEERNEFLNSFDVNSSVLGFAVLGGLFSEGVDLVGDKLIGAVIVSVGLPKFSEERDMLKEYFDEKNGKGFQYAYMYPGFNKVMQSVGRVIRSETDKGAVLLIDKRFNYKNYRELYPEHWSHAKVVKSIDELEGVLENFWSQ